MTQKKTLHDYAKEALGNQTTRKRGLEKTKQALKWIYEWGYSSPSIIDKLVSPNRGGYSKKLVEKGLLNSETNLKSGGDKYIPGVILTLTELGLHELTRDWKSSDYRTRFNPNQIKHDIVVQELSLIARRQGFKVYSLDPSESKKGQKQPDAIWEYKHEDDYNNACIELEFTMKKLHEFDNAIYSIHNNSKLISMDYRSPYNNVIIISDSLKIIHAWRDNIEPGTRYDRWHRKENRSWAKEQSPYYVNEHLFRCFWFIYLPEVEREGKLVIRDYYGRVLDLEEMKFVDFKSKNPTRSDIFSPLDQDDEYFENLEPFNENHEFSLKNQRTWDKDNELRKIYPDFF